MGTSNSLQRRSTGPGPTSFMKTIHLVLILLSTISHVASYTLEVDIHARDSLLFQRLEKKGQIHVDESLVPAVIYKDLVARNSVSENSMSTPLPSPTKATRSQSSSVTVVTAPPSSMLNSTSSVTPSTSATASTTTDLVPSALPSPFDTSLGNNFTVSSCPTFFNTFLANTTFKSCLPVSLLLQNSMGFFRATRSASFLNSVLDSSCGASLAICSPLMSSIADDLIDDANCGQDYRRQNPIVMQAYTGLMAYEPLYNATCLPNKATGNYCFAEAVVNASNPADLYPYYTALGIPLPVNTQPTCRPCLQQTMGIFAGYARQKDQPLAHTYVACATQIDGACGPTFARTDIKVAVESSKNGAAPQSQISASGIAAVSVILSWLILL